MSIKNWPGGRISSIPPTPSGPFQNSTASGVWTLDQQAYWKAQNQWPTAGNVQPDPFFENVTMLLHGDGTNGAQNNTFLDSSTNNFTITRNGNTTQGSFSPYGTLWSNFFNGTNGFLAAPNNAAFAFGTGDYTIEAWIFPTSVSGLFSIFSSRNNTTVGGVFFGIDNGGLLTYPGSSASSGTLVASRWTHVATCRQSGTLRMFINGVLVDTNSDPYNYADQVGRVGDDVDLGGAWFPGYISNLRVVKGAALYTSAFTPPTTPLTAVSGTSLLTCQSNRFIDNSSNNFTITVNGVVSVQRFSPFQPTAAYSTATIGGSGYFDGAGDYLQIANNAEFTLGTNWTMEAWIYPTTLLPSSTIFGRWFASVNNANYLLYFDNSGSLIGGVQPGATAAQSAPGVIRANCWSHVAMVYDGTTLNIYRNGVVVATTTSNESITANGSLDLTIGANTGGDSPFLGYMTDVRFLKGTALYTSAFTPPTAPLSAIANTSLLLNYTNGAIFDNAMMNDLETVGNAQISTSVVKFGTGSMAFDGSGDSLNGIAASPNFQFGTGDFTVEMWVYTSNLSNYQTLLDTRSADTQSAWCLFLDNTGKPYWYDASGVQLSSTAVGSNTWTHLAVSRSGSTLRMFLSGVQVFSGTNSNAQNPTGTFYVGRNTVNAFLYTGYIDDLRITKGVARYTANFTPPTAAFPDT